jgi:uncharacterized protein YjbJ (UPF0337 family)
MATHVRCHHPHCHHRFGRIVMTSTTDKIKGAANQAAGAVKKGVGEAVGNPKLQVEGAAQKLKGHAQGAVGDAKDAVKEMAKKVADKADKL